MGLIAMARGIRDERLIITLSTAKLGDNRKERGRGVEGRFMTLVG